LQKYSSEDENSNRFAEIDSELLNLDKLKVDALKQVNFNQTDTSQFNNFNKTITEIDTGHLNITE
jgi:hypothetical protein